MRDNILFFKKLWLFSLLLPSFCYAQFIPEIKQVLQINTRFNYIVGYPTWLIIIRDMSSGQILPYLYDIRDTDNFWIAFSMDRTYKITVSKLKFNGVSINNFCHLENGIIYRKSFFITVTGDLTPDPYTSKCHVIKYNDTLPYTIVPHS